MCKVLGITKSGYYKWRNNRLSNRQKENMELLDKIRQAYAISKGTYGSPRITAELHENGIRCGKNRIAGLMRQNRIFAKTRRRFKATTYSRHNLPIADNILERQWNVEKPDRVWLSDITYIPTNEGWLYLSAVLDAYSRQIVGWSMSERITQELVTKAFEHAVDKRKPEGELIFHSDRGSQYASEAFQEALKRNGCLQSMSGKGNCYDNAMMESFFHTLKTEHVYFERYKTRDEARQSIFEYIEVFYNRIRRHSALGYLSPLAFEQKACLT